MPVLVIDPEFPKDKLRQFCDNDNYLRLNVNKQNFVNTDLVKHIYSDKEDSNLSLEEEEFLKPGLTEDNQPL